MRSASDLTAAALIREAALRLFAASGADGVSVRDIAAAAGVSPGLIIHHYKSKAGLKEAVDERVLATLAEMLAEFSDPPRAALDVGPIAAAMAQRFAAEPALPAYLRRILIDGGQAATDLLRQLFAVSLAAMRDFQAAGLVRPSEDETARTAFLLVNDMAVLVLREQITALLGVDPLGADGMARWAEAVLDVYANGFIVVPEEGDQP